MIREAPSTIDEKPRWSEAIATIAPSPPRSFRLDSRKPLAEALRTVMLAQLDGAVAASASLPKLDDPIERASAVRIARKATKRLRAMLPLLQGAASEASLAHWGESLRRCGRLFSAIRDRDVRGETIASIARDVRSTLADEDERDALDSIIDLACGCGARPRSEDAVAREATSILAALRRDLELTSLAPIGWSSLRRRVRADWRRLRRRLRRDLASGCDERLHACRKSGGRLEARLLLVESLDPRRIRSRRRRLSAIYDDLGADRDLHLAAAWLCRSDLVHGGGGAADRCIETLLEAIARSRRRFRRRLSKRIERIPRSRPGAWRAIRRDPSAPKEPKP
jgi:hypothetical protein